MIDHQRIHQIGANTDHPNLGLLSVNRTGAPDAAASLSASFNPARPPPTITSSAYAAHLSLHLHA
jgi:hypothetical protein